MSQNPSRERVKQRRSTKHCRAVKVRIGVRYAFRFWATAVRPTRSALTCHSRAAAAVSYEALLDVLGLRLAKYRPVTPSTCRGGREIDRGGRTGGGGFHERAHQRQYHLDAGLVFGAEAGVHHARVQHGRGDAGAVQAAGQLVGEHDVGQLRGVVGMLPRIRGRALQVVEVDAAGGVRAGGDGDDPRRRAGLQAVQQQVGEQERGEMVEGEGVFQAVGGDVPVRPEAAHVVDQHIQPRIGVEYLAGQAADLGLGGHVGDVHVHRRVARRGADVGRCGLGAERSRPVMPTRAPRAARPTAVALPMPPVPPVTRTFLPVMLGVSAIADSLRQTDGAGGRASTSVSRPPRVVGPATTWCGWHGR